MHQIPPYSMKCTRYPLPYSVKCTRYLPPILYEMHQVTSSPIEINQVLLSPLAWTKPGTPVLIVWNALDTPCIVWNAPCTIWEGGTWYISHYRGGGTWCISYYRGVSGAFRKHFTFITDQLLYFSVSLYTNQKSESCKLILLHLRLVRVASPL
jgi:hypothetical protein